LYISSHFLPVRNLGQRGQNTARHNFKFICCCKLQSVSSRQHPFVFRPANAGCITPTHSKHSNWCSVLFRWSARP
jgi:hypothetical protein